MGVHITHMSPTRLDYMICCLSLLFLRASALSAPTGPAIRSYEGYSFNDYLNEFEKAYHPSELEHRQSIFEANLQKISQHNAEFAAGEHQWFMAVNQFADATSEEFAAIRATIPHSASDLPIAQHVKTQKNPDSMDWRTKGAVTNVKNQGGCGSCWAFSATETVESHYIIASGNKLELAPQTYVNCVQNPKHCGGTGGCEGATMELAFNLTITDGIALESDLPYRATDEKCTSYKAAVKATGYVKNEVNSADALETALATKGPVSVTVAAGAWQLYGGGVFHGCSKGLFGQGDNTLDHGVQAVGYTSEYWIVRNSWGPAWGEKGFIRISRASDNATFIDSNPADGVACKPYPG